MKKACEIFTKNSSQKGLFYSIKDSKLTKYLRMIKFDMPSF